MIKKPEIFSSCCAFGGGTEEVHVLMQECPIKREFGKRKITGALDKKEREEACCIYKSAFQGGYVTEPCEHYQGTKKVKRDGRTKYKVQCTCLGAGSL